MDNLILLFREETEIEIEEFALEKMLRALPLRWEEHLELLRVFQQSEMGQTPRMTTIRVLMETAFESILANLIPFVRAHTRRYERQLNSSSLQREDLVGTGIIGIAKALRCWDREKGPFLHYAKIWMTNEILDQLRSQNVVHAKEKMAELQGGLDGALADLMVKLQREPNILGNRSNRSAMRSDGKQTLSVLTSPLPPREMNRQVSTMLFLPNMRPILSRSWIVKN
jgi:RNA polymerase sigma factor (sigma-70 family)